MSKTPRTDQMTTEWVDHMANDAKDTYLYLRNKRRRRCQGRMMQLELFDSDGRPATTDAWSRKPEAPPSAGT